MRHEGLIFLFQVALYLPFSIAGTSTFIVVAFGFSDSWGNGSQNSRNPFFSLENIQSKSDHFRHKHVHRGGEQLQRHRHRHRLRPLPLPPGGPRRRSSLSAHVAAGLGPYPLNHQPHYKPYILRPRPYTLNPQPETLNPKPLTLTPKHQNP